MCSLHRNLRPSSASGFPKSQDVKKLKMKMMMRHTPPSIYTRRGAMLASIFAEKNSSSEEKRRNWKSRRARVEHNFVHNRRDVWWCTTSRKDKHKPFEVLGVAAVLDSFSDQRCCAAMREERLFNNRWFSICERKQSTNKNHGFQTQVQNLIFMSNLKLTLIKRNTLKLLCDYIVTAVK